MRGNGKPAKDTSASTITPDDTLILAVLLVMLAGVLWLTWYMFGGTDDTVGLLQR